MSQDALDVPVILGGLRGQRVQVARPALDRAARVDLTIQHRSGVLEDVVDVGLVGLAERGAGVDGALVSDLYGTQIVGGVRGRDVGG